MGTVTKAHLARTVADQLGLPVSLAEQVVNAAFGGLASSIMEGRRIEIRGFGTFKVVETNPKPNARNPKTGETVPVPARRKVMFRPGKILKTALHSTADGEAERSAASD